MFLHDMGAACWVIFCFGFMPCHGMHFMGFISSAMPAFISKWPCPCCVFSCYGFVHAIASHGFPLYWPWVLLEVFPVQRVFRFHCIGSNFVCTPELCSCSCLGHGAVAIWALYFVDLASLSARALPDTVLGGILPVPPCLKVVQHFFQRPCTDTE